VESISKFDVMPSIGLLFFYLQHFGLLGPPVKFITRSFKPINKHKNTVLPENFQSDMLSFLPGRRQLGSDGEARHIVACRVGQMVTVDLCGKNKTACSILHHCLVVIKQLLKLF
jgi:hypothetical protein